MSKRALLVGCNYPGTKVELHGCVNDVKRMHQTLVSRYGFDASDILVMVDTDPQGPQPTGANIRSSLAKLVKGVGPGDVLVFHYSGHGTQVPPEKGTADETGAEEAIVPTDMNLLTDDDFRDLVNQIPPGASFTFLSDSCHSGGLIDAEKEQIGDTPTGIHSGTGGYSTGGGAGGGGGLMGLVSQGLQAYSGGGEGGQGGMMNMVSQGMSAFGNRDIDQQTRDFELPSGGRRRDEGEFTEEGYGGEGRQYGEEGSEGRRRQGGGGYGEEGYGGDGRQYGEEGYEGRRRQGGEGYGEEGYGGERRQLGEQGYEGRRRQGGEEYGEEGYGGGQGRTRPVGEDFEGEGRRPYGEEGYKGEGRRRHGEEGYGEERFEEERRRHARGENENFGRHERREEEGFGRHERRENEGFGRHERSEEEGFGRRDRKQERGKEEGFDQYERTHQSYGSGYQQAGGYEGSQPSYGGGGYGERGSALRQVSREIPVSMLTQILSERTGHQVGIGNIRTTIFDMFGDQSSPAVKMFVNVALQQLQQGGAQGGVLGTVSNLATQFLRSKLNGQTPDEAASYAAPAEAAGPQRKNRVASDVGILISGCQSNETSADANPSHNAADSYGAFSNAIQTVLSQNDAPMTNRELVLAVRKVLIEQGFKQHPCLYCSDPNADSPFITHY